MVVGANGELILSELRVQRVRARYSGRVQGVGFRATTVSLVHGESIVGWVRNESDGAVVLEAQAPLAVLTQFLARIDQAMGPKIQDKTVQWIEIKEGEKYFSIRYS